MFVILVRDLLVNKAELKTLIIDSEWNFRSINSQIWNSIWDIFESIKFKKNEKKQTDSYYKIEIVTFRQEKHFVFFFFFSNPQFLYFFFFLFSVGVFFFFLVTYWGRLCCANLLTAFFKRNRKNVFKFLVSGFEHRKLSPLH